MEILKEQKILFIQTAFLGDAILSLPAIQEYKKKNPAVLIDVLCIPSTADIFSSSSYINKTIVLDKKGKHKGLLSFITFCKKINNSYYKRIYSFHRSFRTSFLVLLSGVKETFGFNNASFSSVYKYHIRYDISAHEVERNFAVAGLDVPDWRKSLPELNTSDKIEENELTELNILKGFIAIAPGTVWETKKYPTNYYKEIIEFLTKEFQVVLVGGKQDSALCDSLVINKNVISLAGKYPIPGIIEILRSAAFIISNDSAPSHFGLAADKPVLMLYCSTVPSFGFYPYNSGSSWLSYEKLDCKPCGIHGHHKCPLGHFKCGYELTPETVINHIKENYLKYVRSSDY